MPKVQETSLEDHRHTPGPATAWPQRLLDGPRGVGLFLSITQLADAEGVRVWECEDEKYKWRLWSIERLNWTRVQALRILQGATLQDSLGPRYAVIDLKTRPAFSPSPGVDDVYLAELTSRISEEEVPTFLAMLFTEVRPVLPSLIAK